MLRTDFKDDVFEGNRKYNLVDNPDGTVSLIDTTEYVQEGDAFGATEVNQIAEAVNEAFQSASDGKQAIKNAITGVDPEVIIPADPTFAQLATAIGDIETGIDTSDATATAGDILLNKTAYAKGNKLTGTMPDRGTVNHNLPINGSFTIPAGKHSGSGKVTQDIPTKGAETITPGTTNKTIGAGQYLSGAQTILGDPDLIPANILQGKNIFGVAGNVVLGKKFASGSIPYASMVRGYVRTTSNSQVTAMLATVSGLSFTPRIVIIRVAMDAVKTGVTMYSDLGITYAKFALLGAYTYNTTTGESFINDEAVRADVSPLYVNYGGFCLPAIYVNSSATYDWFGWE